MSTATAIRKPRTIKLATESSSPKAKPTDHRWAHAGVYGFILTSAYLNALANGMHAPTDQIIVARIMGAIIPMFVLILCKVAGTQHRRRRTIKVGSRTYMLAYFTAGVSLSLLVLSVYHCACSIQVLTGSPFICALMMAITIDVGLVACELDVVLG